MSDLVEIAEQGGVFRLFSEVSFAEPPARIPVFPKPGTYKHPSYGEITLTPERLSNFVANFNSAVYQKHIPIDAEHKSKLSGALGYIESLAVNADGSVDAGVSWTDRGERLVAGDRFKYVSPEWFNRWEQPDTEVEFSDVLVGLALTTRPFFKDASLRPLVAREGEIVAPAEAPKEVPPTGDEQPTVGSDQSNGDPMSEQDTPVAMTEEVKQQFAELQGQVKDLTEKFTEADTKRQAAEDRLATVETERRRDGFIAEVTGKSAANGHRWFGDVEKHVAILESLGDEQRQMYIEQQRETANRMQSILVTEKGSDANISETSAEAAINRKATELRTARPELTQAQAFTEAMNGDRDLAKRYMAERRTNTAQED